MTRGGHAVAAAALAALAGCIVPLGARTGPPVGRASPKIVAGRTTVPELVALLGRPAGIAAAGEYATVRMASAAGPDAAEYDQQADAWLELFSARGTLRERHRVYYWNARAGGGVGVLLPLGLLWVWIERRSTSLEELWVLVDERTGEVVDRVGR